MPVYGRHDSNSSYTTYRAVPDLGYVPVLYCTTAPEAPPTPGPLQRSASGASHKATASLALAARPVVGAQAQASVVLVPAKVETVECSIPIKVYPGFVFLTLLLHKFHANGLSFSRLVTAIPHSDQH